MSATFIQLLEKGLQNTNYDKRYSRNMDINLCTFFWSCKNKVIVDVLIDEMECCVTSGEINNIYVFYDDDLQVVADDVIHVVKKQLIDR